MTAEAAQGEAVKNSMFPGTALMYWLGTRGIHELQTRGGSARRGRVSSRTRFTIGCSSYGAIPVPLIARLMTGRAARVQRVPGRRPARLVPPGATLSNDLLIVGYDREPDTLNRFSTHILEDIQTPVVEGLTITDEQMNILPLLAREVPTLENGGVRLRPDGGMDVTWRLRPGITWHDGKPFTSADVKFTVDAINDPDYNPESTDGFDRISSVDTPDPLTAIVHYREVYAPYALQFVRGCLPQARAAGTRHRSRERLQSRAARHRAVPGRRVEDGRIHPARARGQLLGRHAEDRQAAVQVPRPTRTRASTS